MHDSIFIIFTVKNRLDFFIGVNYFVTGSIRVPALADPTRAK